MLPTFLPNHGSKGRYWVLVPILTGGKAGVEFEMVESNELWDIYTAVLGQL